VDLYPLDPLRLARPDPVPAGWAQAIHRGPRTVAEVLAAASQAMDAQDEAERAAADPITYTRVQRARRTLWGRLMHGRG
jgi:hypothetical protein